MEENKAILEFIDMCFEHSHIISLKQNCMDRFKNWRLTGTNNLEKWPTKSEIHNNFDYYDKQNLIIGGNKVQSSDLKSKETLERFKNINYPTERVEVLSTMEKIRRRKRNDFLESYEFKNHTMSSQDFDIPYYSTREETVSGNCCCQAPIPGCMDETACNYNPTASVPCGDSPNELKCGECGVAMSWLPCQTECHESILPPNNCALDPFIGCPLCGDCCQNVSDMFPSANGTSGHCAQYHPECCDCNGECNGDGPDGSGCIVDCNGECGGTAVIDCRGEGQGCCGGNTGNACWGIDLCSTCLPIDDNDGVWVVSDCIGRNDSCCGCIDEYCETGQGSYWVCDDSTLQPHADFPAFSICSNNDHSTPARIDGGCTVCGTNTGSQACNYGTCVNDDPCVTQDDWDDIQPYLNKQQCANSAGSSTNPSCCGKCTTPNQSQSAWDDWGNKTLRYGLGHPGSNAVSISNDDGYSEIQNYFDWGECTNAQIAPDQECDGDAEDWYCQNGGCIAATENSGAPFWGISGGACGCQKYMCAPQQICGHPDNNDGFSGCSTGYGQCKKPSEINTTITKSVTAHVSPASWPNDYNCSGCGSNPDQDPSCEGTVCEPPTQNFTLSCPKGHDCDIECNSQWLINDIKCGKEWVCTNEVEWACDDGPYYYCENSYTYDCNCDSYGQNCETCWGDCGDFNTSSQCDSESDCEWNAYYWCQEGSDYDYWSCTDDSDCGTYCTQYGWQNRNCWYCGFNPNTQDYCDEWETGCVKMDDKEPLCDGFRKTNGNLDEAYCAENPNECVGATFSNITPLLLYYGHSSWGDGCGSDITSPFGIKESCIKEFKPYWKCAQDSSDCGCSDTETWCGLLGIEEHFNNCVQGLSTHCQYPGELPIGCYDCNV